MLKEIKISDIKVGSRHRKDMGDLTTLAESIRLEGLLQPIGVTDRLELVFGERRIRAVRDILKKKTILARIVDVTSILAGEYHENEVRKDFTPSERVAIARAIERQIGNRRGQRTDRERVQEIAQVDPGEKTRDTAAERAGFGNHETYRQAAKVVESGTPRLIQAMDEGRVSISAASILGRRRRAGGRPRTGREGHPASGQGDQATPGRAAAQAQDEKTPKPQVRPKRERLKATRLICGDCRHEMKKLASRSIDLLLTDPPYPEIDREYGRMTEEEWHDLMRVVVAEGRRLLKPTGSMVVVLQPNFEKVGRMRLWPWDFVAWAGREWNLVQDAYWWSYDAMPLSGTNRKQGLLRQSVKMCVWLGPANCYRNQENVLWMPSDTIFAEGKSDMALRTTPSGRTYRDGRIADTAEERGGTTPFNLLPVPAGATSATSNGHPASLPYGVAAWWVKYLLPQGGVLLDCFCGSGTMLAAGLDFGASKVIGIEQQKKYIKIAEKRIGEG